MNNYFIILAAGKGSRFSSKKPKQFLIYNGKPIIEHSIDKALESKIFKKIILVINKNHKKFLKKKYNNVDVVYGGRERCQSSTKALSYIKKFNPKNVFIHDAARPYFKVKLLKKMNNLLKKNSAVIPYINTDSSTKFVYKKKINNLKRENVILTQTPQCFNYKIIYKLSKLNKKIITDDASLFINENKKIKFIKSDKQNIKITTNHDLISRPKKIYYGIGFDIHRLIKNKPLYLGGIKIPFHSGLKGHSDGDVILHSIIDAILGGLRKKDIGYHFPNNKNKFKNIRSTKFVKKILSILKKEKYYINNLDINVIAENPKISIYRKKIIKSISELFFLSIKKINIKGKTSEKLGLIGKEKAIACEAIVSLEKYD